MRSNGMGVSLTRAIPIFITMPGMTIGRFCSIPCKAALTTSSTGT
jgi:hypothetical protein